MMLAETLLIRSAPMWVRVTSSLVRRLPAARYRAIRAMSGFDTEPFIGALPRSAGGLRFVCDLRDVIARDVCFTGMYEPQETSLVNAILRPGDTFVDVGANWGYFTLLGAHAVGWGGRVISLEPDPRLFAMLRAHVDLNDLDQVTCLPIAAAAESGELTLSGFAEDDGNFGLSRVMASRADAAAAFVVNADTLDSTLAAAGVDQVTLLKMDIEGFEAKALRGLDGMLGEQRVEHLIVELHPAYLREHGDDSQALVRRVLDFGYTAWAIDHSPAATRRAAYSRGDQTMLLRAMHAADALDRWPHVLFARPRSRVHATIEAGAQI